MDFMPEEFTYPVYIKFEDEEGQINWGVMQEPNQTKARVIEGSIIGDFTITDEYKTIKKVKAPSPFIPPPAIIGTGHNYKKHIIEVGAHMPKYPVVFMKNPSAIVDPYGTTYIPKICQDPPEADLEMEVAIIIKKKCKDVSVDEVEDYILGYTVCNDCSSRLWQAEKGSYQVTFSKSFDTYLPIGPTVVMQKDFAQSPKKMFSLRSYMNGKILQNGDTSDMLFSFKEIVSFLSQSTTLLPGTIILTGAPGGVPSKQNPPRFLQHGDELKFVIPTIGTLYNTISWDKQPKDQE